MLSNQRKSGMGMTLSNALFAVVSHAGDGDVAVIAVERATGQARAVGRYAAGERAMPMAITADQRSLFVATRGASPAIVRFAVDIADGRLARCEATPISGSYAYVTVDASGRYLLGASYGQSVVDVYRTDRLRAGGGNPEQSIADIVYAHAIVISADGRFAYATSLGGGEVVCFRLAFEDSSKPLVPVDKVVLDAAFGPRHLRVSPCQRWIYVVSEFRATVAVFRRDTVSGRLTYRGESPRAAPLQHLNVGMARPLPNDPNLNLPPIESMIWGADIHVRPDGRFVYVSERTLSKLLVYRVVDDGGVLEYAGEAETEAQPRGFNIDSTGSLLIACGEKSDRVSVYAIDGPSGALSRVSTCPGGNGANWIEVIEPRTA
jgi:6-phosphogluconolactonase